MQIDLEDSFHEIALEDESAAIILCDRGVMDVQACITHHKVWQAILDETGWNPLQLRDCRYEAVIHMVTAADGALEFYNLDSSHHSLYRVNTPEEAIAMDKKLVNAWVGHPHFSIIDNNSNPTFQKKIERCVDTVLKFIGLPTPTSFYKKFLLQNKYANLDSDLPADLKRESFQI